MKKITFNYIMTANILHSSDFMVFLDIFNMPEF